MRQDYDINDQLAYRFAMVTYYYVRIYNVSTVSALKLYKLNDIDNRYFMKGVVLCVALMIVLIRIELNNYVICIVNKSKRLIDAGCGIDGDICTGMCY